MDIVSETFELFDKHVPHGHEAFMVLQAHLLVEMRLREFVCARISDPSLLKEIFDRNSPVSSGKGLTILARSLADRDEIPLSKEDIRWKAIGILNNLRNDLAHNLEPNSDSITQKMKNFIDAMGNKASDTESVNRHFRSCTLELVGYLGIHRDPADPSDFDTS